MREFCAFHSVGKCAEGLRNARFSTGPKGVRVFILYQLPVLSTSCKSVQPLVLLDNFRGCVSRSCPSPTYTQPKAVANRVSALVR